MAIETQTKFKAGTRAFSTTFSKNVDVVRVYKATATIRTWGGPRGDVLMTMRGQSLDTLCSACTCSKRLQESGLGVHSGDCPVLSDTWGQADSEAI